MGGLVLRHSDDDDVEAFLDVATRSFLHQTGRRAHWTAEGMRRMRALPTSDPGSSARSTPSRPAGPTGSRPP